MIEFANAERGVKSRNWSILHTLDAVKYLLVNAGMYIRVIE